jgi:transposase
MGRFIEGCDRHQKLLLPDCVDDYVGEDSPVRVIDVFIDELNLMALGFAGSASTGRPGYHPAMLLKLYLYGYLNRVQSTLPRCHSRTWLFARSGRFAAHGVRASIVQVSANHDVGGD